jgi:hypothetical protein
MEMLNQLVPELFSLVPAECIAGTRLGFYVEMLATLLIPPILFGFTVVVVGATRGVKLLARRARGETTVAFAITSNTPSSSKKRKAGQQQEKGIVNDPRVQTVTIFLLLCVYPMICRKVFSVFDCVEAGVVESTGAILYFLRDDPVEQCYTFNHNLWTVGAIVGVLTYCVGVPLTFFLTVRRYRARFQGVPLDDPEHKRAREGVILLIDAYRDKLSYPESASMLHKCFFTGLVLVVMPDTKVQVWLGASASLFAFFLYLLSRPCAPTPLGSQTSLSNLEPRVGRATSCASL